MPKAFHRHSRANKQAIDELTDPVRAALRLRRRLQAMQRLERLATDKLTHHIRQFTPEQMLRFAKETSK